MPVSDLGLASDKILSLTRISGDGSAGSIDTYEMTTRAGEQFQFSIQNGRNGAVGYGMGSLSYPVGSSSQVSAMITALSTEEMYETIAHNFISCFVYSIRGFYEASIKWVIDTLNRTYDAHIVYRDVSTGSNPTETLTELTSSNPFQSGTTMVILYKGDDPSPTIDTELNPSSTNLVENQAIAKAVSVGVADDADRITESEGSYASYADLAYAIENNLPFNVRNEYVMRYCGDVGNDIAYAGAYIDASGVLAIRVTFFNTDEQMVLGSDVYTMATESDIDNLFVEEAEE